ncbi:hypothetical protein [Microvirga antarctica]|uniref:hypothetical protein n=1 Tax=Microvirga antarctica TaxID=2819233 RepID=UPI001FE92EF4|nr:hypothetical protein [Microvirga antarctica]
MNSSISSSEARSWRAFTGTLLIVAAMVLGLIVSAAYMIDPYDTGRSVLLQKAGVRPQGPRTAAASRGRDQAFDAAIVGNSHIQLLSPDRLKATTGLDFVQLAVPASGPKEHLTLIDWFLRHRERPAKALVISVDDTWCNADSALTNEKPFPFWLFAQNPLTYARGLLRYDILEEAPRRLAYVAGRDPERARPDGYWDYEPNYIGLGYDRDPVLRQRLTQMPHAGEKRFATDPRAGQRSFPAADRLRQLAETLPAELALVIVFPAAYTNLQPPEGTEPFFREKACKAAITAAAQRHGRSAIVDWRVDRPENRDASLFFDMSHYRQPIARAIEDDVARALKSLP